MGRTATLLSLLALLALCPGRLFATSQPASSPASTSAPAPSQEDIDDFAEALGLPTNTRPSQEDIDDFAEVLAPPESAPKDDALSLEDQDGALVEPGGEFAAALSETKSAFFSWESYQLWRDPILVNALAALICGFLGVYVILRRMVFVSAAISQISSVGVVLGFYLSTLVGIERHEGHLSESTEASGLLGFLTDPLWLAIFFALAGAAFFAWNAERKRMTQESLIGLGYTVAAALVLAILSSKTMTHEAHSVESILFGDAAVVESRERFIVGGVALGVFLLHLVFFRAFLFCSMDAPTARTLGLNPQLFSVLLLMSLGLVISTTTRAIGPLPVFAYLVIPPAAALLLTDRVKLVFLLGALFGLFSAVFGYYASWMLGVPTKAAVVVTAALTLLPGLLRRGMQRFGRNF